MPELLFSAVRHAGEETVRDESYHFDNSVRPNRDFFVVQRTIRGTAFLYHNGRRELVSEGHAMLFTHRENSAYGFAQEGCAAYRQHYVAFTPAPPVAGLFRALRRQFGPIVQMARGQEPQALLGELVERFLRGAFRDRFQESELLYRLLIELYREQVQCKQLTDPIEFGWHYLRDRFRSAINVKTVAVACGITREHFIREFRRRYGETPAVSLRTRRLEHARTLLSSTRMTLEAVAIASGFASRGAFTRSFQRQVNVTPQAYRQRRTRLLS